MEVGVGGWGGAGWHGSGWLCSAALPPTPSSVTWFTNQGVGDFPVYPERFFRDMIAWGWESIREVLAYGSQTHLSQCKKK